MTDPATPPDRDTPLEPRAWARPLYAGQIAMLDDLAQEARDVAGLLARRIMAVDADDGLTAVEAMPVLDRLARAHGRASRAVRLTLMLQARLMKDLEAWDRQAAQGTARAVSEGRFAREERAEQQRGQVERVIERVADQQRGDAWEIERLVAEASERLDREDVYGDILSKPVSEWVDLICRDLGLDPDWPRLSQEAWAVEEINGAVPGWPLAAATDRSPPAHAARMSLKSASP
jgi:hypothetical protein